MFSTKCPEGFLLYLLNGYRLCIKVEVSTDLLVLFSFVTPYYFISYNIYWLRYNHEALPEIKSTTLCYCLCDIDGQGKVEKISRPILRLVNQYSLNRID